MTLHPKAPKDLLLAPVAAGLDLNLQHLRDRTPREIDEALALALNLDTAGSSRTQRRGWILDQARRYVDLHDWQVEISSDETRLQLRGGSVSLDLGLSAAIQSYITDGC